ncbi:MAG: enterochelin esterase [Gammaproteobacteria bacterium]|jgi:enterochelin esterase-like enzyme|nr:enterochelin esterase [Gammaproteobacteria bacterium]MBT5202061.1 enterochelin esterase [Gammaproteobacteria bacterium]MBT5603047.1 enterochelin esterase [Gammaproteobacteria bacterium]MBT6245345.1 enterochelin esterase [Gammaproteobacteria bacterium]
MPQHPFSAHRGRISTLGIESKNLDHNLLGDPGCRQVGVYLPEGIELSSQSRFPLMVDLAGFTGSGFSHLAWKSFAETLPQRIDRLIDEGLMGPSIIAFPDCFTSLGGNQYIDTSVMGNWSTWLVEDMLPQLIDNFPILSEAGNRAVFGKSSGGYGAMLQGMTQGDQWGAVACHSGDMNFQLCYQSELPRIVLALQQSGGSIKSFLDRLGNRKNVSGQDMSILMMLAMAASYDPDPASDYGIRLPVTLDTCELIPERWQNWQAWDPLTLVEDADVQSSLSSLKNLYIDCGNRDQYYLMFGARALTKRLGALGINHSYEEFEDNHSGIDYRMDLSLPSLYQSIKP